jgi:hypothetical protein
MVGARLSPRAPQHPCEWGERPGRSAAPKIAKIAGTSSMQQEQLNADLRQSSTPRHLHMPSRPGTSPQNLHHVHIPPHNHPATQAARAGAHRPGSRHRPTPSLPMRSGRESPGSATPSPEAVAPHTSRRAAGKPRRSPPAHRHRKLGRRIAPRRAAGRVAHTTPRPASPCHRSPGPPPRRPAPPEAAKNGRRRLAAHRVHREFSPHHLAFCGD